MIPAPEEEDVALVAAGGMFEFFRRAWHIIQPFKLSTNWHHRIICRAYEALLAGDPRAEKVCVNIPPGSTKSILLSVIAPAYAWGPGKRPDWRCLRSSFDMALSLRDSNACKALVTSEWYQRRWGFAADPAMLKRWGIQPVNAGGKAPKAMRKPEADSASEWWTTGGGMRFATSVQGKGTGWHFHEITVDDPTKPLDIQNGGDQARASLEKGKEWWSGTMSSRRVNPDYLGRWVVMQRLHTEDLSAEVLKAGYTPIVVPARHELARPCRTPYGNDPRTQEGESFWPERFGEKGLNDLALSLRRKGEAHVAAQLQQDPIPDGGAIFKPEWLAHRYRLLPAGIERWWQSWDCSFGSLRDSASFVVGQVWAQKGGQYYLVDQFRRQCGLPDTIQAILALTAKYPRATRILVEDKANGPAVLQTLKGRVPGLLAVSPEGGKVARANEASVYFEAGNVLLPESAPWLADYVAELLAFPQGAHDDQVDATSQALNWVDPGRGNRLSALADAVRSGRI